MDTMNHLCFQGFFSHSFIVPFEFSCFGKKNQVDWQAFDDQMTTQ